MLKYENNSLEYSTTNMGATFFFVNNLLTTKNKYRIEAMTEKQSCR